VVLNARVLWPLFPLLLLIVVVCLTWALVYVVRRSSGAMAIWLQAVALGCYLLPAAAAIASERHLVSASLHRPFSLLTQLAIAAALFHVWRHKDRPRLFLNMAAWVAILADTALHSLPR